MVFEYDSVRHFTDGRASRSANEFDRPGKATRWSPVANFNDKTWLDRMGHAHSDQLRVIERIQRVGHDHLVDDLTIDDPKAYTKPWTAHLTFILKPKWTLAEAFCEDEQSFEAIDEEAAEPAKK
jgi:hypothetical protein